MARELQALSARTLSGRVRGRPAPMRGTLMPSRTAWNWGESPCCPAVTIRDSTFRPCRKPGGSWWSAYRGSAPVRGHLVLPRGHGPVLAAGWGAAGAGGVLVCAQAIVESTLTSQVTQSGRVRPGLPGGDDLGLCPCPLPPPEQCVHRPPGAVAVRDDGRPDRVGTGNSGSSRAHCSSVRSSRLVTARVATRSPVCSGSSWSTNPISEISLTSRSRHARLTGLRGRSWVPGVEA